MRVAIEKYLNSGVVNDLPSAIDALCMYNIEPGLSAGGDAGGENHNVFRNEQLYCEEVDVTLRKYQQLLRRIFERFCKPKMEATAPRTGGRGPKVMLLAEWSKFMEWAGLLGEDLPVRSARLYFSVSKMRWSDEVKDRFKLTTMDFLDFCEGLARIANVKDVALDAELEFVGASGVVELEQLRRTGDAGQLAAIDECRQKHAGDAPEPLHKKLRKMLELMFWSVDQRYGDGDGLLELREMNAESPLMRSIDLLVRK